MHTLHRHKLTQRVADFMFVASWFTTVVAGRTALHIAAIKGDPRVARTILEHTTEQLLVQDDDGSSPISLAARHGHISSVQQMLLTSEHPSSDKSRSGFNLFERAGAALLCHDGRSSLVWAAQNGHAELLSLLLTAQATLGSGAADGRSDALQSAAQGGHAGCVESLLHIRATVDSKDSDGWTALMVAATEGHGHVCALLVQARASVFATNDDGMTAADLAEREGHDHILPLLTHMVSSTGARTSNILPELCSSPIIQTSINMNSLE